MDERIGLLLDMGMSAQEAQKVITALDGVKVAAKGVADTYEIMARAGEGYIVTERQMETAMDRQVREAVEQTRAQKAVATAIEDTATAQGHLANATAGATNKMAGLGQAGLQSGRILQDFTQGGIGGILNNIEGLSLALGGGPGLAGILTAAGIAVFLFKDKLKGLFDEFQGGKDKIPETADRLERLAESIKKTKEATEELRKQESLNYGDMEKFREGVNKLKADEEELANARAARAIGGYAGKADVARAAAFRGAVGEFGGGEKLVEELMRVGGRTQPRAEEMVAEAMKGNLTEIGNIIRRTEGFAQFYTSPEETARLKANQEVQKRIAQDIEKKNQDLAKRSEAEGRGAEEQVKNVSKEVDRIIREGVEEARDAKRAEAAEFAAFKGAAVGEGRDESARQAAMRAARGDVAARSQFEGYGTPNAMETERMAREATSLLESGMNRQEAAYLAVDAQVKRMRAAAERLSQSMQGNQGNYTPNGYSASTAGWSG